MAGKSEVERLVDRREQSGGSLVDAFRDAGLIGAGSPPGLTWNGHGRPLLNFVASDYLGFGRHPFLIRSACVFAKRSGMSTGLPRLLGRDPLSRILENELACLVRQEKAALFSSTTHAALDILPLLAGPQGVLFVDGWAYPISLEGAYAAARQGAKLVQFSHNDTDALEKLLKKFRHIRDKVIVCDGVYSAGGDRAPLKEISLLAGRYGAVIYVDDAHGLGILGGRPERHPPFGLGGGGTPAFENVPGGSLVYIASLSKALGVPLAFAAGPAKFIDFLNRTAPSFVHSSQPATPMIAAGLGAIRLNRMVGDPLRGILAGRVRQLVDAMAAQGIELVGKDCFPIQSLYYSMPADAFRAGAALRRNGLWPLVQLSPPDHPGGGVLRFVISACHSAEEIQQLVHKIRTIRVGLVHLNQ